jgi:lipoyl(octanoyl) transferase
MELQKVRLRDIGKFGYQEAWDLQKEIHGRLVLDKLESRKSENSSYKPLHELIFVEHPHVYTLGRSGEESHLLVNQDELIEKGATFVKINRGGDITYHGPRQLVAYPIFDLDYFFNDVHRYVRNLEEVIIRTLAEYGLKGQRIEEFSGVWIFEDDKVLHQSENEVLSTVSHPGITPNFPNREKPINLEHLPRKRKICAIGVHMSRWVTMHGLAFNVDTDLEYFNHIVPCGIAEVDKGVTSLSLELGTKISINDVKGLVAEKFAEVFDFTY